MMSAQSIPDRSGSSPPILEARSLCVGYKKKVILDNLTFAFEKGCFIGLLGPNGAGKTTLLRTLSRHLTPVDGGVLIEQQDLRELPQRKLAKAMSVVLTEKVAPPLFKVHDFVALGRYPHTGFTGKLTAEDEKVVLEAITMVGAEPLLNRDINTLSDGERQKILIARALAQQPRVILLDEPTMHLDLKHRMEVMSILRRLCREKGICVVASLHDVDVAAKLSDKVGLIKNHQLIALGPPEDVLQPGTVSDLYDFEGAGFSRLLGGIELRSHAGGHTVFVVGGMGSAAVHYRLLAKRDFSIATGILHENDLDYFVARSIGATCLSQPPMEAISNDRIQAAKSYLREADLVIDTGFMIGHLNRNNLELIRMAFDMKKPVVTFREDVTDYKGMTFSVEQLFKCRNEAELLGWLEKRFERVNNKP